MMAGFLGPLPFFGLSVSAFQAGFRGPLPVLRLGAGSSSSEYGSGYYFGRLHDEEEEILLLCKVAVDFILYNYYDL